MKNGFTLAEVLITLGIIGIVAAMTMPTLIENYQKKVLETQYKSTVSVLSQGFKNWAENDDIINYNNNKYNNIPNSGYVSVRAIANETLMNKYFKGKLTWNGVNSAKRKKYIQYNQKSNTTNVKSYYVYTLNNGIELLFPWTVTIFANDNKLTSYSYTVHPIVVDINGMDKKPNKIGYDLFQFALSNDGTLIPQGSAQYALFLDKSAKTTEEALSSTYYWKAASASSNNGCRKENYTGPGYGCGARIMEENWKMNY